MNRMLTIGGISIVCALCLALVVGSSAQAQGQRPDEAARALHAAAAVNVAKTAYSKLKAANEVKPDAVSSEELSRASLEWFKFEVAAARTKPKAIKAATEYLEREGAQ